MSHVGFRNVALSLILRPTRIEESGVLGGGSIPVAKLPSCQDMQTIAL